MSEENAETTVENVETVEQLQERLRKAEAKIVDMKKSATQEEPKETERKETGFDEDAFERKYEEKKFFESNPEMLEYKDKLAEYVAKGLGYNEAKVLLENTDETIRNRQVAKQTNFTSGDTPSHTPSVISKDDLAKAEGKDYDRLMGLIESGKATLTN